MSDHAVILGVRDATGEVYVHHIAGTSKTPHALKKKYANNKYLIGAGVCMHGRPYYLLAPDGTSTVILTITELPFPAKRSNIAENASEARLTSQVMSALTIYVRIIIIQLLTGAGRLSLWL